MVAMQQSTNNFEKEIKISVQIETKCKGSKREASALNWEPVASANLTLI